MTRREGAPFTSRSGGCGCTRRSRRSVSCRPGLRRLFLRLACCGRSRTPTSSCCRRQTRCRRLAGDQRRASPGYGRCLPSRHRRQDHRRGRCRALRFCAPRRLAGRYVRCRRDRRRRTRRDRGTRAAPVHDRRRGDLGDRPGGCGSGQRALPMSEITVSGVPGLPEIAQGANLATLIAAAVPDLADGDILVVTSKIISKAEGRVISADRDDAIAAETVRVVARRGATTIAQTRHGLVLAAAGVDRSNTAPGTVVLLPEDPDGSAKRLRKSIGELTGANIGVLVTDTMGRPWRNGQTDVAIGAAGLLPLRDHRGQADRFGNTLEVTVAAVADEIAAAAELVKGKTDQVPVAVVRGLPELVIAAGADPGGDGPGAAALIRPAAASRCAGRR